MTAKKKKQEKPMTLTEMKNKILEKTNECGDASFAELHWALGDEAKGDFWLGYPRLNIYLWAGISEKFSKAIDELIVSKKIYFKEVPILLYILDGHCLKLPLAKRYKQYKTEHWIPVVFIPIKKLESEDGSFQRAWKNCISLGFKKAEEKK